MFTFPLTHSKYNFCLYPSCFVQLTVEREIQFSVCLANLRTFFFTPLLPPKPTYNCVLRIIV